MSGPKRLGAWVEGGRTCFRVWAPRAARVEVVATAPTGESLEVAAIPDPQSESTFRRSVLDWSERDRQPHAGVLRLHRALIRYRLGEPSLFDRPITPIQLGEDSLILLLGEEEMAVVHLWGQASLPLGDEFIRGPAVEVLIDTESPEFTNDPVPIVLDPRTSG